MSKWSFVYKVPGGHRYYREAGSGRIGVADDSGQFPDQTQDGVLYLDPSRPIRIDGYSMIPVVRLDGEQLVIGESASHILEVAVRFGFNLRGGDKDRLYSVAAIMDFSECGTRGGESS